MSTTSDDRRPAQPGGRSGRRRGGRRGEGATVPPAEIRTYHDQPVLKAPVWTWEIPLYFFIGGAAGASAIIAPVADAVGDRRLARVARLAAGAGAVLSPPLLIRDLGMPSRFHHMLRVLRPTSPMSVGSWTLALFGPPAVLAAALEAGDRAPTLRRLVGATATVTAPALVTYTAVLFADTAIPVWHEARHELPALFAASGTASAGAIGVLAAPGSPSARAVAVTGAVAELAASQVMAHRLGDLAGPYEEGTSGRLHTAAGVATAAGAALLAWPRRRTTDVLGAAALLAGALLERWAVFRAGFASAADPAATVRPQRARLDRRQAAQRPDV